MLLALRRLLRAAVQTIVTSGASTDAGMFETNLRDERFLPFVGAGAVSTGNLSLPAIPSFDYDSISDVILHIRYTARDGGAALASLATAALHQMPPVSPAGQPQPMAVITYTATRT